MGYLFQSEIEKLLKVSKMFFIHKKRVAWHCARLPFCVGYQVCLGPTPGDTNIASPRAISPSLKFFILNMHNDTKLGKLKKWPDIYLKA